jgi:hypothetical protein
VEGPGFFQIDTALEKNTQIPWFQQEHAKLQFRVDLYNILNHKNLQGWDTNLADSQVGHANPADPTSPLVETGSFGKINGQGQARTLQLQAQLRF